MSNLKTRKAAKIGFVLVLNAEKNLILIEKEVRFLNQPFVNRVVKKKKSGVIFAVIACNFI